jgi:hypothetical protein
VIFRGDRPDRHPDCALARRRCLGTCDGISTPAAHCGFAVSGSVQTNVQRLVDVGVVPSSCDRHEFIVLMVCAVGCAPECNLSHGPTARLAHSRRQLYPRPGNEELQVFSQIVARSSSDLVGVWASEGVDVWLASRRLGRIHRAVFARS